MKYTQISARVAATDAEGAADILRGLFGAGVWLEAPFVQPDLESDAIVDRAAAVVIHVYVPESTTASDASLAG